MMLGATPPWMNFMLGANDKVINPNVARPSSQITEGMAKQLKQGTKTDPFGKTGQSGRTQSERQIRGTRIPQDSFQFGGDYGFAPPVVQPMNTGALPAPGWGGVVGNTVNPVY